MSLSTKKENQYEHFSKKNMEEIFNIGVKENTSEEETYKSPYKEWDIAMDTNIKTIKINIEVFKTLDFSKEHYEIINSFLYKIDKYFIHSKLNNCEILSAFLKMDNYTKKDLTIFKKTYLYNYIKTKLEKNLENIIKDIPKESFLLEILPLLEKTENFYKNHSLEIVKYLVKSEMYFSPFLQKVLIKASSHLTKENTKRKDLTKLQPHINSIIYSNYKFKTAKELLSYIESLNIKELTTTINVFQSEDPEMLKKEKFLNSIYKNLKDLLKKNSEKKQTLNENDFFQIYSIWSSNYQNDNEFLELLITNCNRETFKSDKSIYNLSVLNLAPGLKNNTNFIKKIEAIFKQYISKQYKTKDFKKLINILSAAKNFNINDKFITNNILKTTINSLQNLQEKERIKIILKLLKIEFKNTDKSILEKTRKYFKSMDIKDLLTILKENTSYKNINNTIENLIEKKLSKNNETKTIIKYISISKINSSNLLNTIIEKFLSKDIVKKANLSEKVTIYEKTSSITILLNNHKEKTAHLLNEILNDSEKLNDSDKTHLIYTLMLNQNKNTEIINKIIESKNPINIDNLTKTEKQLLYRAYQYFKIEISEELENFFWSKNKPSQQSYYYEKKLYEHIKQEFDHSLLTIKKNVLSKGTFGYEFDILVRNKSHKVINIEFDGDGHTGIIDASRDEFLERKNKETNGKEGVYKVLRFKNVKFKNNKILEDENFKTLIKELRYQINH